MKYRILYTSWEEKSFTKAAEKLNLTQSAVSHSVNTFEKEMGFPVFHRLKSGLTLTEEGKILMPYFERLVMDENRLYNQIHAINAIEKGTLRVGSFASASTRILPEIIKAFDRRYPNISVELIDSDYDVIKQKLNDGHIDIAVLEETYIEENHYTLSYLSDEMMMIAPLDYFDQRPAAIPVAEVSRYPFIMPDNDQDFYLKQLLKAHGAYPSVKYKFQLLTTVFAMVEVGLGISVIPESALLKTDFKLDKYSFEPKLYRNVCLTALKTQMDAPVVKGFFEIARCIKRGTSEQACFDE